MNQLPQHFSKLFNPSFNLREICKQFLMLEDHLIHPDKRCPDCITKHFLTAEGLFDELGSLDPTSGQAYAFFAGLMKGWHESFLTGIDPVFLATNIRSIRKDLCQKLFGY